MYTMNSFLLVKLSFGNATIYIMKKNGVKQYVANLKHTPFRINFKKKAFNQTKDAQRFILINNKWLRQLFSHIHDLVYYYGYDKIALVGDKKEVLEEVKKELKSLTCRIEITSEIEPLSYNQLFNEEVVNEDLQLVTEFFQTHIDRNDRLIIANNK